MLRHLVIGVHDQGRVQSPLGQLRVGSGALHDVDIADAVFVETLPQAAEGTIIDVDRKHASVGAYRTRQAGGEEAITGTDIRHGRSGADVQRRENLVNPLPSLS